MSSKQEFSNELTVGELIQKLQQYDEFMPICGFSDSIGEFVDFSYVELYTDRREEFVLIVLD
jgi:hypothetical protein